MNFGKCDVCGGIATDFARDIIEIEPCPVSLYRRYRPGDIHLGCDLHPPESRKFSWGEEEEAAWLARLTTEIIADPQCGVFVHRNGITAPIETELC